MFQHGDRVKVDAPGLHEFDDLAPYNGQTGVIFCIEPGRHPGCEWGVRFDDGRILMFATFELSAA